MEKILKIETEYNDKHQVLITVELGAELERKKRQVARKLSQRTKIPGFRPGKAPYRMVVRYVSETSIAEEALKSLVGEIYPKVIEESGITHYRVGRLEGFNLENTPTVDFLVPLAPEVEPGDYRSIRLPYEPPIEKQLQEEYEMEYNDRLIEEVLKDSGIRYPPEAVDDEIDVFIDQFKNRIADQGLDMDTFLKTREMDETTLREEFKPLAENRVRQSLILLEIAKAEGIQVDAQKVEADVQETIKTVTSTMTEKEARKVMTDDVIHNIKAKSLDNAMINQAMKHLRVIASGAFEKDTDEQPEQVEEPKLDDTEEIADTPAKSNQEIGTPADATHPP